MPKRPTRRSDFDSEQSEYVMYEFVMSVPHDSLDPQKRAAIREAFEHAAEGLRTTLIMLDVPIYKNGQSSSAATLRATRIGTEYRAVDMFGDGADYPKH